MMRALGPCMRIQPWVSIGVWQTSLSELACFTSCCTVEGCFEEQPSVSASVLVLFSIVVRLPFRNFPAKDKGNPNEQDLVFPCVH